LHPDESLQDEAVLRAVAECTRGITTNPQLVEAHYRGGVAYDRLGEKDKAKQELLLHDQIEKAQADAVERQRREVKPKGKDCAQ
jgi:transaldolase